MCHKKDFPRYDDLQHIDSNGAAPPHARHMPRVDPAATEYTEMYCEPTQCIDKTGGRQEKKS